MAFGHYGALDKRVEAVSLRGEGVFSNRIAAYAIGELAWFGFRSFNTERWDTRWQRNTIKTSKSVRSACSPKRCQSMRVCTRRGNVAGCVFHTDRGSQFRSRKLRRALDQYDMVGSMGRVGAAGDNAAMESFFSLLQKNVLNHRTWATRDEFRLAIVTWIERTYHRRRRQLRLGRLTSVEYEAIMNEQVALAA